MPAKRNRRLFGLLAVLAIVALMSMAIAPFTALAETSGATSHPTKPGYPWTTHATRVPGSASTMTLTNCTGEVDGYQLIGSGNWKIGGSVFCSLQQQSISMVTYFDRYVNGTYVPYAGSPWGHQCYLATYCTDDKTLDLPSGTYFLLDNFSVVDYNNHVSGSQQYTYVIVP